MDDSEILDELLDAIEDNKPSDKKTSSMNGVTVFVSDQVGPIGNIETLEIRDSSGVGNLVDHMDYNLSVPTIPPYIRGVESTTLDQRTEQSTVPVRIYINEIALDPMSSSIDVRQERPSNGASVIERARINIRGELPSRLPELLSAPPSFEQIIRLHTIRIETEASYLTLQRMVLVSWGCEVMGGLDPDPDEWTLVFESYNSSPPEPLPSLLSIAA